MTAHITLPKTPLVAEGPLTPVIDYFKLATAVQLSSILNVSLESAFEGVESGKGGKSTVGDFNIAIPRFRLKSGSPKDLAEKVVKELVPNQYISSAIASGPFLSVICNTANLTKMVLEQINYQTHLLPSTETQKIASLFEGLSLDPSELPEGSRVHRGAYGTNSIGAGKKLVVEFSSPNIAKPFHAGHLRSTIIGAFLANLYEANGWDVLRMNYLGDWGKQFGILAVGFEKYGSEEELERDAITHLYDVYVKINKDGETDESVHDKAREFFVGMENGDKESIRLWKKFRDLSIVKYRETYGRLNIRFDIYSGESQVSRAAQETALSTLQSAGIVQESKGALIVDLAKYKLGTTIVRKKDGTYVYITRDIGGAAERWEKYKFDKMIYVVANQQDLHLAQFFKVLDLMGYDWANRLQHINFGMVLGMSTRKGTAVFLDQILNEAKAVMHEQMRSNEIKYSAIEDPEETSDKLGITAVKIQDMSAKRGNNYKFEWSRMTSFEGDTGPYLQYAHVRLSSVERKNAPTIVLPAPAERAGAVDTSLLTEPKAREIIALLAIYPEVVKTAFKSLEPSTIVTYCWRLCHAVSSAWEVIIVKDQPRDVALARLWLFVSARDVLSSAMKLLTLDPLTRM